MAARRSLFEPVRTLGLVCNALPSTLYSLGSQNFILSSTGFGYRVYDADTLRVKFTSSIFPDLISALSCERETVFIAFAGSSVVEAYHRETLLWRTDFSCELTDPQPIQGFLPFGNLLLAHTQQNLLVFDVATGSLRRQLFEGSGDRCQLSPYQPICHPIGLVNQVVVGTLGGVMRVFDVVKGSLVKELKCVRRAIETYLEDDSTRQNLHRVGDAMATVEDWIIDVIQGSPTSVGGVVVAASSTCPHHVSMLPPLIFGVDLATDEVIAQIQVPKSYRQVTSIAIKEGSEKEAWILLLGSRLGHIGLYDLLEGHLIHELSAAHCDRTVRYEQSRHEEEEPPMAGEVDDGSTDEDTPKANRAKSSRQVVPRRKELVARGGISTLEVISVSSQTGLIFLSGADDNSLKLWHLSEGARQPVVLKSRIGFSGRIAHLDFYDESDEAKELLVAAGGQVGKISYILAQQDLVFPTAKALKRLAAPTKSKRPVFTREIHQLPPVVSLHHCIARHYDWPAVVTCHEGLHQVMIWSALQKTLMPIVLELPQPDHNRKPDSEIASLTKAMADLSRMKTLAESSREKRPMAVSGVVSACGHFVITGYENGQMHHFNLQSRNHIGAFTREDRTRSKSEDSRKEASALAMDALFETNPIKMAQKRKVLRMKIARLGITQGDMSTNPLPAAHIGPVKHISILHSSFVYSASQSPTDLTVACWDLQTKQEKSRVDIGTVIRSKTFQEDDKQRIEFCDSAPEISKFHMAGSSMVVVLTSTKKPKKAVVLVLDPTPAEDADATLLRAFGPFEEDETVVDAQVSPSGSWIIVASLNETKCISNLRTYDIQSSHCVDWTEFPAPITSFTIHPSGAFLLTAHSSPPGKSTELFTEGGVYVWANREVFGNVDRLELTRIASTPVRVNFPPLTDVEEPSTATLPKVDEMTEDLLKALEVNQKPAEGILTLSGVWGRRKLETLLRWDDEKALHQVELVGGEEVAKDEPFFLYDETRTISTVAPAGFGDGDWVTEDAYTGPDSTISKQKEKVNRRQAADHLKGILARLDDVDAREHQVAELGDSAQDILTYLEKKASAPSLHQLLLNLGPLRGAEATELESFLYLVSLWVQTGTSADFVQVILKLFLQYHGATLLDALTRSEEDENDLGAHAHHYTRLRLVHTMNSLAECLRKRWSEVGNDLDRIICLAKHVSLLQFD